jgi:hypothetical protein
MKVWTEFGMTWYEANGRRAVVCRSVSGYSVVSPWTQGGTNWCGGIGAGGSLTKDEAEDLARRFVSGQPVPEDLGGYEDNKPEEVTSE